MDLMMTDPQRCAAVTRQPQPRPGNDAAQTEEAADCADRRRAERDDRIDRIAAEHAAENIGRRRAHAARDRAVQPAGQQQRQVFKADAERVADRNLQKLAEDEAERGEQRKAREPDVPSFRQTGEFCLSVCNFP